MIREITEHEFEDKVLKSPAPVLVDFFATWCGPCKMLAPVLDEFSEEYKDSLIYKVDIDKNPALAEAQHVQSVPTLKIYQNGTCIETAIGVQQKETIKKMLGIS